MNMNVGVKRTESNHRMMLEVFRVRFNMYLFPNAHLVECIRGIETYYKYTIMKSEGLLKNKTGVDVMNYFLNLLLMTLFFTTITILLSHFNKKTEKKVLLPIVIFLISIILFFISLAVGRWQGMWLSYISLSLFMSSIISLILIFIINTFKKSSKT